MPTGLTTPACTTQGAPEEPAPSLETGKRGSFNKRLFTSSCCFYVSFPFSCPLTAAVSRNTLLLDLIQQWGISDSLPTLESPSQP